MGKVVDIGSWRKRKSDEEKEKVLTVIKDFPEKTMSLLYRDYRDTRDTPRDKDFYDIIKESVHRLPDLCLEAESDYTKVNAMLMEFIFTTADTGEQIAFMVGMSNTFKPLTQGHGGSFDPFLTIFSLPFSRYQTYVRMAKVDPLISLAHVLSDAEINSVIKGFIDTMTASLVNRFNCYSFTTETTADTTYLAMVFGVWDEKKPESFVPTASMLDALCFKIDLNAVKKATFDKVDEK